VFEEVLLQGLGGCGGSACAPPRVREQSLHQAKSKRCLAVIFNASAALAARNAPSTECRAASGLMTSSRVFENENPVRTPMPRARRSRLPDDRGDDRHLQNHHFAQIHRDGFRDVPFLGADARVGPAV